MAPKGKKSAPKMSEGAKSYLILYNLIQVSGWTYILAKIISHFMAGKPADLLYLENKYLVQVFQNMAILEIFHVAIGLVKSDLLTTIMQVFSRVALCLGVLIQSDIAQRCIGITPMLTAWSLSEIIRYLFYVLTLVEYVPYIVTWCRYTFFYILYPVGVSGELICMYYSLQTFSEYNAHYLPSDYCDGFRYFLMALMASYIPFFPKLYLHMVSQRKKIIGGKPSKPAKKTQ